MIIYKDRTWCTQRCGNTECRSNFTPEEEEKAVAWGGEDFLIGMSDRKTEGCGYIEVVHGN